MRNSSRIAGARDSHGKRSARIGAGRSREWHRVLNAREELYIKTVRIETQAAAMDTRDPITLIDESIENLTYLIDWLLEDIDVAALDNETLAKDAIRAIAALHAIRALLPRLRIVRSNFESWPSLPDARQPSPEAAMERFIERSGALLRKLLGLPPREN
jgi:hypothetical protein